MSAFVVSNKTINRTVSYMDQHGDGYSHSNRSALPRALEEQGLRYEGPEALGAAMNALNVEAVKQRYPGDKTEDDLPGICGPKDYAYRFQLCNRFQALKNLQCWLYQCSEGDVPEHPLFKALESMSNSIAHAIVVEMDEYDKAEWDSDPDEAQLARLSLVSA